MNSVRRRWANTASGRIKRLISSLKSDLATRKNPAFSIENLEQRQLMTASPFEFSELVFGNDTRSYTDVQGRVAVGGSGNFTGFSVGTSLSDSDGTRDDLIVGGNLTYTNGQIFNGNVRSGGTATLSSWGHPNGSYIAGNPLNFTDLKSQATSTSSYLAGLSTTNSSTFQYGTLTLTGTKAISVINVSGSQLSTANSINLSAPAGGILVLNVSGTSDKMQYAGMNLSGITNSNVIWNFYEATTLTIAGIGVKGTVLAPNATVSFSNGNIDGSLIANNVSGSGEIHYHLYTGPQGQTSVFNPVPVITGTPSGNTSPEGAQINLGSTVSEQNYSGSFTYAWNVTKNGSAYSTATSSGFSFTPNDNGTYVVSLIATDTAGRTGTTSTTINVTNVAPTANISGAASTNEGTSVTYSSTKSDPGSADTHTYTWSVLKGGNAYSLPGGTVTNQAAFTFTPTDDGAYTVRLTVTDDDGDTVTTTASLSVANVARTPSISGASTVNEGSTYTLSLTPGADPGADTVSGWSINWGDGSTQTVTGNPSSVTHVYADGVNAYLISASVSDEDGSYAANTLNVAVANVAPNVVISGASTVNEGSQYTLTLGASGDPGTDTISGWVIDWGDGNTQTVIGNVASLTHTYVQGPSSVTVKAWASDEDGTYSSNTLNVSVLNVAPTGNITGAPASPIEVGTGVTLGSTVIDPGILDTHTFAWVITKDGNAYNPGSGVALNTSSLSWTPTAPGAYQVTLAVTDGDGAASTPVSANISVYVTLGVSLNLPTDQQNEGSQVTIGTTLSGSASGTATYAWTITKNGNAYNPPSGTALDQDTLAWSPQDNGVYALSLTVTRQGLTATASGSVVVENVDPTATIQGAPATSPEGTQISLFSQVTDPGSADTHTYAWTVLKDGQPYSLPTATVTDDHAFAFTPDDDGQYTLILTVTDDDGGFTTVSETVEVTNIAPEISISGNSNVDEGTTYTLALTSGGDPGDDAITSWEINWGDGTIDTITGNPTSATHIYADGDADYQITANATDEDGTYDSNTVDVAVNNVAPEVEISGASTVNEGSTYTLTLWAGNDPGDDAIVGWEINWGDGVIQTITGNPSSVTHIYADGNADYQITATATDEDGTYDSNTVDVSATNVAPQVTISGTSAVNEGATYTLSLSAANDPGTDTIATWEINWGDGTVETITGNPLSVTHVYADGDADYQITATATDEDGAYTSNTIDVTVQNVAPTLTVTGDSQVLVNKPFTLYLVASDPGVDTAQSWTINWGDGLPAQAVQLSAGNSFAITHTYTAAGSKTITATLTDEDGSYTGTPLSVTVVAAANRSPVFVTQPGLGTTRSSAVSPGNGFVYGAQATDPDGDALTYALIAGPQGLDIDETTGLVTWQTTGSDTGNYSIIIQATDSEGATTVQSFNVFVASSPNRPPIIISLPNVDASVDGKYAYDVDATDADGDTLVYSLDNDSLTRGLVIDASTGKITWTPGLEDFGIKTVTVTASDSDGGQAQQSYSIQITQVEGNHAPVFTSDPVVKAYPGPVLGNATGGASPGSITLNLGLGDSQTVTVNYTRSDASVPGQLVVGDTLTSSPWSETTTYDLMLYERDGDLLWTYSEPGYRFNSSTVGPDGFIYFFMQNDWDGSAYFTKMDRQGEVVSKYATTLSNVGRHIQFDTEMNFYAAQAWATFEMGKYSSQGQFIESYPDIPYSSYWRITDNGTRLIAFGQQYQPIYFDIATQTLSGPGLEYNPNIQWDYFFEVLDIAEMPNGTFAAGLMRGVAVFDHTLQNMISYHPWDFDAFMIGQLYRVEPDLDPNYAWFRQQHWAGVPESIFKVKLGTTEYIDYSKGAYGTWSGGLNETYYNGPTNDLISIYRGGGSSSGGDSSPLDIDLIGSESGITITNLSGTQTGVAPGDSASFNVQITGDGTPHVFDLTMVDHTSGQILGTVPVGINGAYIYQAKAQDSDGDTLSYGLADGPDGMSVNAASGQVHWASPTQGTHHIKISVADDQGGIAYQEYDLVISTPVSNTAPSLSGADSVTLRAGKPAQVLFSGADANGDVLSFYLDGDVPTGLTIDRATGTLNWSPLLTQVGLYSFDVLVLDGHGGEARQTLDLTVVGNNAQNDSPIFTTTAKTTAAVGTRYQYDANADDPEHTKITYTLILGPQGMVIDAATGLVTWTPEADGANSVATTVILKAADQEGGVVLQTYTLTTSQANHTPTLTSPGVYNAVAGGTFATSILALDQDGDDMEFELIDPLPGMSISSDGLRLLWTVPSAQALGVQEVSIRVTDQHGASSIGTMKIDVLDASTSIPPVIANQPRKNIGADTRYFYQLGATSPVGRPLTVSIVQGPSDAAILGGDILSWLPGVDDIGSHDIILSVSDGVTTLQIAYSLAVTADFQNSAPTIHIDVPPVVNMNLPTLQMPVVASDPDNDPVLIYQILGYYSVSTGTLATGISTTTSIHKILLGTASDTSLPVVPHPIDDISRNFSTQSVLRFEAVDAYGQSTLVDYPVRFRNQGTNLAPQISSTPATLVGAGQSYLYAVGATDPEHDAITYSLDVYPDGMSIDAKTGIISWITDTNDIGAHQVKIKVNDSADMTSYQVFDLVVQPQPVDLAPFITSRPRALTQLQQPYTQRITAVDPENQTLVYTLLAKPAGMDIDSQTGQISWTPGSNGQFPIVVMTQDPAGNKAYLSYVIEVLTSVDTFAFISTPPTSGFVGQKITYTPAIRNPENQSLTYQLLDAPSGLTQQANNSGAFTWDTAGFEPGSYGFTLRVTSESGQVIEQAISITLTADLSPPVLSARVIPFSRPGYAANAIYSWGFVSAFDNVGVTKVEFALDGGHLSLSAQGPNSWVLSSHPEGNGDPGPGLHTYVIHAYDAAGNMSTLTGTVNFNAIDTGNHEILGIKQGDVITQPVEMTLSGLTADISHYSTQYQKADSDTWYVIKEGDSPEPSQSLGLFDPTLLSNGVYNVKLTLVESDGDVFESIKTVSVDGALKLGNFSLSFNDMTVGNAFPITINRSYDTLNADRMGDFGYGWSLNLPRISLATDLPPITSGNGLSDLGILPGFHAGTRVVLSLPDGSTMGFTFNPIPVPPPANTGIGGVIASSLLYNLTGLSVPSFIPDPGVNATLTVATQVQMLKSDSGEYVIPGGNIPFNPASNLLPQEYSIYTLTLQDGTKFQINGQTGEMLPIQDSSGNLLVIRSDGVISIAPDGAMITAVAFVRDGAGRITSVTDILGKSIHYGYDANGDLISVTDRMGATTQYIYNPEISGSRPHFLTDIISPAGTLVLHTDFDQNTGRLSSLTGPGQRTATFNANINIGSGLYKQTIIDPLGNPTDLILDSNGNIVRQVQRLVDDPDPAQRQFVVTVSEYDSSKRMTRQSSSFLVVGEDTALTAAPPLWSVSNQYDGASNLVSTTDAMGNTTTMAYNAAGQLTAVVNSVGNALRLTYDAYGNPVQAIDPMGHVLSYKRDDAGKLIGLTDAAGVTTLLNDLAPFLSNAFTYDNLNRIIGTSQTWTDPNNSNHHETLSTSRAYDNNGRLTEVTDVTGLISKTIYDVITGRISYSTDRFGNLIPNLDLYDSSGQTIESVVENRASDGTLANIVSRTVYDANGRPVLVTDSFALDPNGLSGVPAGGVFATKTVYDAVGRIIRVERLKNVFVLLVESSDSSINTVVTGPGELVSFSTSEYDNLGRVVSTTVSAFGPSGTTATSHYEYDLNGHQTAMIDPYGSRTQMTYDQAGHISTVTMPLGGIYSYRYDPLGRQIEVINPDGSSSSTQYDVLGRLAAQTNALGNASTSQYGANGELTSVVLPGIIDSNPSSPTYNTLISPAYYYQYDSNGKLGSVQNPLGLTTKHSYDQFGREVETDRGFGEIEKTIFNSYGQFDYTISQDGVVIKYVYSNTGVDKGRLTGKYLYENFDSFTSNPAAPAETLLYYYDIMGNTIKIQDITSAGTRTCVQAFDQYGQMTSRTTPQGTVHYEYDAVTQLCIRTWTGLSSSTPGSDTRYTYDLIGRLSSVTEISVGENATPIQRETHYFYDSNGNLSSEVRSNGIIGFYQYSPGHNLTSLIWIVDLNENHEIDQTDDLISQYLYTYDATGNRSSAAESININPKPFTLSADHTQNYIWTYDALNNLTSESYDADATDNTNDYVDTFSYDLDGNRTLMVHDTLNATISTTYTYNAFGQLTLENQISSNSQTPAKLTVYEYGNENTFNTRKTLFDVLANAEQKKISEYEYQYNVHGQLARAVIRKFDTSEALVSETDIKNTYDYSTQDGYLVLSEDFSKTFINDEISSQTKISTSRLLDMNTPGGYPKALVEIQASPDNSDTKTTIYTNGLRVISQSVALSSGANTSSNFVTDAHGSTRILLTDPASATANQFYNYSSFGVLTASHFSLTDTSTLATSILYSQESYNPMLGLQNLSARFYDPSIGRFASSDPLNGSQFNPKSYNQYIYTNNNPINNIDPSGKIGMPDLLTVSKIMNIIGLITLPFFVLSAAHYAVDQIFGKAESTAIKPNEVPSIDIEYAKLAQDVYGGWKGSVTNRNVGDWLRATSSAFRDTYNLPDTYLSFLNNDDSTPTSYGVAGYTNMVRNIRVIAFKGTNLGIIINSQDILEDLIQGTFGANPFTPQYNRAAELGPRAQYMANSGGHSLVFVGHSLGGGLASWAHFYAQNQFSATYNAAGISLQAYFRGFDHNDPRVSAYYIKGEFLHQFTAMVAPTYPAMGIRYELEPYGRDRNLNPQTIVGSGMLHIMSAVLRSITGTDGDFPLQ